MALSWSDTPRSTESDQNTRPTAERGIPGSKVLGADVGCRYWPSWAGSDLPRRVWSAHVRPLLDLALQDLLDPEPDVPELHGPTTKGCLSLDIPRSATVAYLFAAACAVGDSACAAALGSWLRGRLVRRDRAGI